MLNKNHAVLALTVAFPMMVATAHAATIRVPQDHSAIQSAIDVAAAGDTVLVAPGTYQEVIDFKGKAITVASSDGAGKTIIDAGRVNAVVRFHSGETRDAVLVGFTLQNGFTYDSGGGVQIFGASPTVRGNTVRNNGACGGNGISVEFSSALIAGNHIHDNHQDGCTGGTVGGGILLGGWGRAEVVDNLIEHNQIEMSGGGIGMNAAGKPFIARNTIRFNTSGSEGGGVSTMNRSSPTFVNNAVYGNTSEVGGGVSLFIGSGIHGGFWINNTIADNVATKGSELFTDGFTRHVQLTNNIFRTSSGTSSVYCGDSYFHHYSPQFRSNDFHATNGAVMGGLCVDAVGAEGNIAVDPLFNTAGKGAKAYALTAGSPAIDVGAETTLPGASDLLGQKRRLDGNGDGSRVIDLGAIEYRAH